MYFSLFVSNFLSKEWSKKTHHKHNEEQHFFPNWSPLNRIYILHIYYKLKNLIHYWKQFIETFQTVDVWRISYKTYLKLFEKWPSISLLLLDKWLTDVEIRIRKLKFISPIGPILSSEVKKTHYIPWTCCVALNTIDLYGLDHM